MASEELKKRALIKCANKIISWKKTLVHCANKLIIEPRFQMIAILDTVYENLIDDYPIYQFKIQGLKKNTTNWILGPEYTGHQEWIKGGIFPEYIDNAFRTSFNHGIDEFCEKYIFIDDTNEEEFKKDIRNRSTLLMKKYNIL